MRQIIGGNWILRTTTDEIAPLLPIPRSERWIFYRFDEIGLVLSEKHFFEHTYVGLATYIQIE